VALVAACPPSAPSAAQPLASGLGPSAPASSVPASVPTLASANAAQITSQTERLLHSTVRIVGSETMGTGFILTRRANPQSTVGKGVIVTAAHLFVENPHDDVVQVTVHASDGRGSWKKEVFSLPIRRGGKRLWVQHDSADVAAIPIPEEGFPVDSSLQGTTFAADEILASDATIAQLELGPGDELFTFGYPLGFEVNGFALLRGGYISSYPLMPMSNILTFILDFTNIHGNSGGPVFYYNSSGTRHHGNGLILNSSPQFYILGLVSAVVNDTSVHPANVGGHMTGIAEERSIGLASIPNSAAIQATLDKLPPTR
jgi:hypothetical protein